MREQIVSGREWYGAMLQAVHDWPLGEEELDGERYVYLIDGEALDLTRLCERLSLEIMDLVSEDEIVALIANDRPPGEHVHAHLKDAIGVDKYRAYLTFIYGVLVEEMVVHAVVSDLRKRHRTAGLMRYDAELDDAHKYVYGSTRTDLVASFRRDKGLTRRSRITLTELKEFTYWLFKLRLRSSDKSRVASDTKRALTVLHRYTSASARTRR
ncbi:MAG: hypothetical protein JXA58_00115 [Dehalococcoidia bacterium]|nr:hypothetical protein [Dehalococcoidia bacterium]